MPTLQIDIELISTLDSKRHLRKYRAFSTMQFKDLSQQQVVRSVNNSRMTCGNHFEHLKSS
jgi:hypothetical protein